MSNDRAQSPAVTKQVLLLTIVVWGAHWGILVTRSVAMGLQDSLVDAGVRLIVATAGCATTAIIYWILRPHNLAPIPRFMAALGLSAPFCILLALANELMWLFGTNYYPEMLGITAADVFEGGCSISSSACHAFVVQIGFTIGVFIWVYVSWCSLYVGIMIAARLRESDQRRIAAEAAAHEAQLNALRFQLHPHFLFNTLNTLSGLVALDRKTQAELLLLNLSDFLRYSLKGGTQQLIRLQEELEAQRMYLDIERARFADRLQVSYEIEEGCERADVPPFLLQPLVENAIKHAVAPSETEVTLTIGARRERSTLVLTVENSVSSDASRAPVESLGIGMSNVRKRLGALYGSKASLEAAPTKDGGWINIIRLPWTERAVDDASANSG